jgi:hypothetical protein
LHERRSLSDDALRRTGWSRSVHDLEHAPRSSLDGQRRRAPGRQRYGDGRRRHWHVRDAELREHESCGKAERDGRARGHRQFPVASAGVTDRIRRPGADADARPATISRQRANRDERPNRFRAGRSTCFHDRAAEPAKRESTALAALSADDRHAPRILEQALFHIRARPRRVAQADGSHGEPDNRRQLGCGTTALSPRRGPDTRSRAKPPPQSAHGPAVAACAWSCASSPPVVGHRRGRPACRVAVARLRPACLRHRCRRRVPGASTPHAADALAAERERSCAGSRATGDRRRGARAPSDARTRAGLTTAPQTAARPDLA